MVGTKIAVVISCSGASSESHPAKILYVFHPWEHLLLFFLSCF